MPRRRSDAEKTFQAQRASVFTATVGIMLALGVVLTGCSALRLVPNQDHGSSGCQNARGIGPASGEGEPPIAAELIGRAPAEAAATAATQGHTVVFNVQIEGYGECWCVPPPEGKVVEAWWGQHGALWLMVDGVDEGHTGANQPARGRGC